MPDAVRRAEHRDIGFAVAIEIGRRGNIIAAAERNTVKSISRRIQAKPDSAAINGDIGFSVAVVVRRNDLIRRLSERNAQSRWLIGSNTTRRLTGEKPSRPLCRRRQNRIASKRSVRPEIRR